MRKSITALGFSLIILFTLAACGNNKPQPEAKEESVAVTETVPTVVETTEPPAPIETAEQESSSRWVLCEFVDDFGDSTSDYVIATTHIKGTFENTVTSDSDLGVDVYYVPYFVNTDCWEPNEYGGDDASADAINSMFFGLREYDSLKVTYQAKEKMTLKIKIGQDEYETELYGNPPNGHLYCWRYKNSGSSAVGKPLQAMIQALSEGETVRCVIYIGSDKYRFDIDGTDFVEAYTKLETAYNFPYHRYKK